MGFIQGEARGQHAMFPTTLDDLIPEDHLCRVIEAFVGRLDVAELGFVRAEPAETGRPGYDPRRRPTPSAAPQARHWCANNFIAKIGR